MQQGVQSASAQPITMSAQFLHHPEANQWFFGRVMEHMQADEPRQEFQLARFFQRRFGLFWHLSFVIVFRYRDS
jgi:hypothetical protein